MKVPDGMDDEEVLFLTDIFPTGYQAAEQAGIKGGEIVSAARAARCSWLG
jgi:threonine dehydrogenase-like Zn-dependent dehydrogenase